MATQDKRANVRGKGLYTEVITNTFTFAGESAGEVIKLVNIQKGTIIHQITLRQAALGSGVQLVVGDSATSNGYITVTTANTAGTFTSLATPGAYTIGKQYTVDDYIAVTTSGGAATGAITIEVLYTRAYS